MSKFDELKKAAQDVVSGHVFVDIEAANMKEFELLARPAAILELLAIQAQLVEALSHPALYELLGNVEDSMDSATWSKAVVFMEARDAALAAAEAQP